MPIRLAVAASLSCLTPESLARFKEAGFESVEFSLDAATGVKPALATAGLTAACIDTDVALHLPNRREWDSARETLLRAIEAAAAIGAPVVRVFGYEVPKGEGLSSCMGRIGARLAPLGEIAAKAGVSIAIQNAGSFVHARDIWQLLETIAHPRIGVCLDAGASAAVGESSALAVPTLNTRIVHVHMWDHKDGKPAPLGQGSAGNKVLVERLRGIGYGGAISLARQTDAQLANVEYLKASVILLKTWLGLITPEPPKVEPAKTDTAKPAATAPKAPAAAKPAAATDAPAASPPQA